MTYLRLIQFVYKFSLYQFILNTCLYGKSNVKSLCREFRSLFAYHLEFIQTRNGKTHTLLGKLEEKIVDKTYQISFS